MNNITTKVFTTKRETVNFAKKIAKDSNQVETKFITQSIYGILKSGSVVLRKIGVALDESIDIKNTIDRLSRNLKYSISKEVQRNYSAQMVKHLGEGPVILVDDSAKFMS